MAKKIYVGRLPKQTTEQQLIDIFSKAGNVISVQIIKTNNNQENSGYGYIRMDTDDSTIKAISLLNNSTFSGSKIVVMEAHFLDQEHSRLSNKRRYNFKK